MGAPDILVRVQAEGINLSLHGDKLIARPKEAVTPEIVGLLRAHKSELMQALSGDRLAPDMEARRLRVLDMLREHPEVRYAVLTDTGTDPQAVLVTLAIRGRATCELRIPRAKYDGPLLLDLIEKHGSTAH